ncbi:BTAD domain-containing putative transcriptional regulator [Actinomycetes bacterium KLBMP 9797]
MDIRLLGEVELRAAGHPTELGTPRQQAVLAALAVDAGRPVPIETVIDRVWGEAPPPEVRNVLYSHLSRIRRVLRRAGTGGPGGSVARRPAGYLLDVDPDVVDLHRFRRLVEQGRDPRRTDADRAAVLGEALRLWRGAPLAGLPGEWCEQVRRSWHRQRVDALVQWAQVELRLGHGAELIAVLSDLVVEYPLVEPLEAGLMRALSAAGREAEALDRYAAVRQRLADELGTDPGAQLRDLHQAILRGEARQARTARERTTVAPAQLPPDLTAFTGRDREMRRLDELAAPARSGAGGAGQPTIVVIDGTAGIGKTTLAVHWAHRVADRFPDGQLYLNLRGFDPTAAPLTPPEAVRGFLDAFEVPPERIPASFAAQVGLYRSVLARRRVLVVLDNARDAEHVRPLLPAAPGCLIIVTSRNRLPGLMVAEGAHPLTVGLPSAVEAGELFAGRAGQRRVAAESDAVAEIVRACARLPLALAMVAARAASHPEFSLAALADELRAARGGGLDAFTGADPGSDLRALFSWSYLQLNPPAARLFRLLGLHIGADITAAAAASLAGEEPRSARRSLAELAAAHLVTEHTPGRYALHDLLRAYAGELARAHDTESGRGAAIRRVLDHYLHAAHAAALLLNPHRHPIVLVPSRPGVTREHLAGAESAFAWFGAEHAVLMAALRHAASAGLDTHAWQLAWTLTTFCDRRGLWHDWAAVHEVALAAAHRGSDVAGQAHAHRGLALANSRLGRDDEAAAHLRQALDFFGRLGDDIGRAHTHLHLAWSWERHGGYQEAISHARQALALHRAAGNVAGQASVRNALGWFFTRLGNHRSALTHCEQALNLFRQLGSRVGEAASWDSLGHAHHHLGQHQHATTCFQHALALFEAQADRYQQAQTLIHLGDNHHAAGGRDSAHRAWRQALDILDDLGHHDAEQLRDRLDHTDQQDGGRHALLTT